MKKLTIAILTVILISTAVTVNADASAAYSDAEAFVVINADTRTVLEGKDIRKRLPMASTTKIMTAILLCENAGDLSETVICTHDMVTVEGSSMGLLEGDTVTYRDLLYGLLLCSGNDAANAIAISVGGSIPDFVRMMNEKAAELGLYDTSFETPSGLDGERHFTSAHDMAVLAAYAMENAVIREVTSTQRAVLYYGNPPYRRSVTNHNKLLGDYEGLIGVKTGFTKKSGRCLVTAARRGDAGVIVVTLNCANDYNNHRALLDSGFARLKATELTAEMPARIDVVGGRIGSVAVRCENARAMLADGERQSVETAVFMPRFCYAPVKAGDVVGRVEYRINGYKTAASDIVAAGDVEVDIKQKDTFFDCFVKLIKELIR